MNTYCVKCKKKKKKTLKILTKNNRFHFIMMIHSDHNNNHKHKIKKILPNYKNGKHIITLKTNKIGKRAGTTYCLECKDYTHNFRPQEVKMTNKLFREKCNCIVCQSNKSRFAKQNKK